MFLRKLFMKLSGAPKLPPGVMERSLEAAGGHNPWMDLYGLLSLSKVRLFSADMWKQLGDHNPYSDLGLDRERFKRWHPINKGVWYSARVHLNGLLLLGKGDRVAMRNSVETRYPFLDEDVFSFLAQLSPRWKMRRFREKYLLRLVAERWLPRSIAWRKKFMFLAGFDSIFMDRTPTYVDQLLSEEALRKTGYFDPTAVRYWRDNSRNLRGYQRISTEMGLAGVVSTQLWHQQYIDDSLADVPGITGSTGTAIRSRSTLAAI
jgi:asparagine synthase (glutamine-hydrolysing)